MVLIHHYFLQPIEAPMKSTLSYIQAAGRLAWSGVDLFFVLSGFLIGGILLDARDSSNYFRVFYTRRFFRIVPIYFVFLTAAILLSQTGAWGMTSRFRWIYDYQLPWFPHFLFLQNFWMAASTTFGALGITITWSLAVEEQFYLTLPTIVRFLTQRGLAIALGTGIVLAPISRIVLHALAPSHYLSWYTLMPCRADALLLGVLAAIVLRSDPWKPHLEKHRNLLPFLLIPLAAGCAILTVRSPDPYGYGMLTVGYSWLALTYACFLLCGLLHSESWLGAFLRWRWLGWLGSIAYGLYLFHEIIRHFLRGLIYAGRPPHWTPRDELISLGALIILLIVCRLSWDYFEKPLIKRGHRFNYNFSASTSANP